MVYFALEQTESRSAKEGSGRNFRSDCRATSEPWSQASDPV